MGGLSKRAYRIEKIGRKENKSLILVDAGNLLFKKNKNVKNPSQDIITARGIIKAYMAMNYDAVAVGPYDLAAGTDFLLKETAASFPWLSANLADSTGRLLFSESTIFRRGNIRIGIIGLTGDTSLPPGIVLLPWQDTLPPLVKMLKNKCDMIILLSSYNRQINNKIGEQFPDINILVGADGRTGNLAPQKINHTLITQTTAQGKYLGRMDLKWFNNAGWGIDYQARLVTEQNRLGSINWQLKRMYRRKNSKPKNYDQTLKRLENSKKTVSANIISIEEKIAGSGTSKDTPSQYSAIFIPLNRDDPDNKKVLGIVTGINKEIRVFRKKQKAMRSNNSSETAKSLPTPFVNLTGFAVCGQCHQAQTEFWQQTGHGKSYKTLVAKKQEYNLDCLPCHITQNGETIKTGNRLFTGEEILHLPPVLQVVGCESCHGPGLPHSKQPDKYPMAKAVNPASCLACHTEKRSDNFNFSEKVEDIKCPAE